jgi:hypothetical protein
MPPVKGDLRVGVIHGPGGRMTPVWFDLQRRKHVIRDITNSWRARQGEAVLVYFHVIDGGALYELVYHLAEARWTVEQIEAL